MGVVAPGEKKNMKWIRMAVLLDFWHCSYEGYVLVTGYFSFLRYKGGGRHPYTVTAPHHQ